MTANSQGKFCHKRKFFLNSHPQDHHFWSCCFLAAAGIVTPIRFNEFVQITLNQAQIHDEANTAAPNSRAPSMCAKLNLTKMAFSLRNQCEKLTSMMLIPLLMTSSKSFLPNPGTAVEDNLSEHGPHTPWTSSSAED